MDSCVYCGSSKDIQPHHISYEPEMKIPLCKKCHEKVHGHGTGISKGAQKTPKICEFPRTSVLPNGFITVSDSKYAYIPDMVRNQIQNQKIPYIIGGIGIFMYEPKASEEQIMRSLDVLKHVVPMRRAESNLVEVT